jgi:hypothetical protein
MGHSAERDAGLTEAEREALDERVAGGWWGYYIHFEPTGVPEIDRLLSAVGLAGKMYHHTSDWNEDDADYGSVRKGESPVDFIQRAANDAARAARLTPPAEPGADRAGGEQ